MTKNRNASHLNKLEKLGREDFALNLIKGKKSGYTTVDINNLEITLEDISRALDATCDVYYIDEKLLIQANVLGKRMMFQAFPNRKYAEKFGDGSKKGHRNIIETTTIRLPHKLKKWKKKQLGYVVLGCQVELAA